MRSLTDGALEDCWEAAIRFIQRFRAHARFLDTEYETVDLGEAKSIAERLERYFAADLDDLIVWPKFVGCGWLDEVEGDILVRDCLYEVKAGAGPFRAQDLRQVLCYAALALAAGSPSIASICLVNPRTGLAFRETLEAVCIDAAGNGASETLNELVSYVSEPLWEPGA